MIKKLLIGVVAVVAGFLGFAAMQPDTYSVSRSVKVDAPAGVVFGQINNFKAWQAWSPWDAKDPAMKRTYVKEEGGMGASYAWVGNKDVGSGKMDITASEPDKKIVIDLEFKEPFASKADTLFTFEGSNPTTVTWKMSGKANLMSKAMGIFMPMDKMIGPDFEKGLASIKTVSEKAAKELAAAPAPAAAPPAGGEPAPEPAKAQ